MKRLCVVIALVLLSSACRTALERTKPDVSERPTAEPKKERTVGSGVSKVTDAPRETRGRLELTLVDTNGLHPAQIPVLIGDRTYTSDTNGRVVFTAKGGNYSAKVVAGCRAEINVHSGGTAAFGIVEGETIKGELNVAWRHRYHPSGPARSTVVGDWPIGDTVDVIYAVMDDCSQERAKNVAFPWFSFHTSSNVDIVGKPSMRSDEHGNAVVSARCTARGAIGLKMLDRDDPKATFPLDEHLADFGGTPECG